MTALPLLDAEELRTLSGLARRALWAPPSVRAALQAQNVNITPANFYSAIPSIAEIDRSWEHRRPGEEVFNGGLFDPPALAAWLDRLAPFADEFDPPLDPPDPKDGGAPAFHWRNPAFSYSDALAYYCTIRALQPEGIVEVGAGFSTLIADLALRRNGHGRLTVIEPWPKPFLRKLETIGSLIEEPVQDVPLARLVGLVEEAGLWFIDSTHTVKSGSDCLWLYLKAMPALSREVVVHSHDIFLPFGFPKGPMQEKQIYWTEQYLLYAYLLDNPRAEVLFSSAYGTARMADRLGAFMGGKYPMGGGSIWYRIRPKREAA
ncbi:MAG: class I SAM-dependent methyltransferase [Paracoccaceae bacterium]